MSETGKKKLGAASSGREAAWCGQVGGSRRITGTAQGVGEAADATTEAGSDGAVSGRGERRRRGAVKPVYGEPMSSHCLRRAAWWTQLREMDDGIQRSDTITGKGNYGRHENRHYDSGQHDSPSKGWHKGC